MNKPTRPEDVLSENSNYTQLGGVIARKGSVAAFLKNIELLEISTATQQDKEKAVDIMRELVPVLIGLNFHKHVTFHNETAQKLLDDEISKS